MVTKKEQEKWEERRFQVELAKWQSGDSIMSSMGFGFYVLGVSIVVGSYALTENYWRIIAVTTGVIMIMAAVIAFSRWRETRESRMAKIEADFLTLKEKTEP
jgi:uncharacterized membrane protein